jgi:hypothetical protein
MDRCPQEGYLFEGPMETIMPATSKITHLTESSFRATRMAATCWQTARAILRARHPDVEDARTPRCPATEPIAEATDPEGRLQQLFSAGF